MVFPAVGRRTWSPIACLERGLCGQNMLGAPAWREPRTCRVLVWMGTAVLRVAVSTQCSALPVHQDSRGLVTSHEEQRSLTLRVFLAFNQVPQVQVVPNATNTCSVQLAALLATTSLCLPIPPVGLLSPSLHAILPQPPLLKEQWTQAPSTESTAEVKTRFFY